MPLVRLAVVGDFIVSEYVWRNHQHRRVRWGELSRRRKAIAFQDGWSTGWIGLILGGECQLIRSIDCDRPRYPDSFGPDTTDCSEAWQVNRRKPRRCGACKRKVEFWGGIFIVAPRRTNF